MAASHHLNSNLFHGTHNPEWRKNPNWIHLGERAAAENRITEGFYPWEHDTKGEVYQVELHPHATVYPKTVGTSMVGEDWKDESGKWHTIEREHDLGMMMDNQYINLSHPSFMDPSGKPYDVYPYQNIVEGGTSYVTNPKAIRSAKKVSE